MFNTKQNHEIPSFGFFKSKHWMKKKTQWFENSFSFCVIGIEHQIKWKENCCEEEKKSSVFNFNWKNLVKLLIGQIQEFFQFPWFLSTKKVTKFQRSVLRNDKLLWEQTFLLIWKKKHFTKLKYAWNTLLVFLSTNHIKLEQIKIATNIQKI